MFYFNNIAYIELEDIYKKYTFKVKNKKKQISQKTLNMFLYIKKTFFINNDLFID